MFFIHYLKNVFFLCFLIFCCPGWASERLVFAHYMICCSSAGLNPSIDDYKREIISAKSVGIDGFALNCGLWFEQNYREKTLKMYAAAAELGGFKLFVSLDQKAINDIAEIKNDVSNLPAQFYYDGKPVMSTFGGQGRGGRNVILNKEAKNLGLFFVPYYFPYPSLSETPDFNAAELLASENVDADGFFYFGAAGNYEALSKSIGVIGAAWKRRGKIFMAGVTPFYRGLGANYRIFDGYGLTGFFSQWASAIKSNADWIEIVTWNDWGESTYVAPFGDLAQTNLWGGHYGKTMLSHDGYFKSLPYFISWFKSGKRPPIDREFLLYFYRPHSVMTPSPRRPNSNIPEYPGGILKSKDELYFSVFLKSPATISACIEEECHKFYYPSGVNHASIPLSSGTPSFQVERDGRVLRSKNAEVPIDLYQSSARFNYFSGSFYFDGD